MASGEDFDSVWSRHRDHRVLVVMGIGFDVRATVALERIVAHIGPTVDLLLLELPVDSTDPAFHPLVRANESRAERFVTDAGGAVHRQPLPDFADHGSLGRLISRQFQQSAYLNRYVEIIVEISAMPRSVYFPLVRGILERAHAENNRWPGDLHVAVCEHPGIDELVSEEGTQPMAHIGGFGGNARQRQDSVIWVPVIGEGAGPRLSRLHAELNPDETCPVLPWPSRNPRRSDQLVLEHRDLFFQTIRIEPRNFINASEHNPFDLYRTIGELNTRYQHALSPLGSVGMVLSSHSSKLLSLGVLISAYDFDLEVQHVSPGGYSVVGDPSALIPEAEVFDLWLTGAPYGSDE